MGPVNGISAKMARGIVCRLTVAGDVHKLCSLAIEKADQWLATVPNPNLNCRGLVHGHYVSSPPTILNKSH